METEETLTLTLNGNIRLDDFAHALQRFHALLGAIADEVTGVHMVSWEIEQLAEGSAITTVRPVAAHPTVSIAALFGALETVGLSLERGAELPYSPKVRNAATKFTEVIRQSITGIQLSSPRFDAIISARPALRTELPRDYSYGLIQGRIETITSRKGPKFFLYDLVFDHAIICFLQKDDIERMGNLWNKIVEISGLIGREIPSYRPFIVREINNIEILATIEEGSYRRARGSVLPDPNAPAIDSILRRIRDE